MSSQLGKIILLKEELKKSLNDNNYKEAERILRVIDTEYKKISNKALKNFLTDEQIKNIEEFFGKKISDIIESEEKTI